MDSIFQSAQLSFFKAEKYEYNSRYTFDVSNCPRPHFCMGLILDGEAVFKDSIENEDIHVKMGDIIFVPVTGRYVSEWRGNPKIAYESVHFLLEVPGVFSRDNNYKLQKVTLPDFEYLRGEFEAIIENIKEDRNKLLSLSHFFNVLSIVLPELKTKSPEEIDTRLKKTIKYIEEHYTEQITIDQLAEACNMSASRFFPAFKKQFIMTPMDYLNHYRIHRASVMLIADKEISIEQISENVGYSSSEYFRRIFKRITGKTPREYRKAPLKI